MSDKIPETGRIPQELQPEFAALFQALKRRRVKRPGEVIGAALILLLEATEEEQIAAVKRFRTRSLDQQQAERAAAVDEVLDGTTKDAAWRTCVVSRCFASEKL